MKTKRRLLSLLISLAMILTFMPAAAFAGVSTKADEGSVAAFNGVGASTLRAAFEIAAKSSDEGTIEVLKDIDTTTFSESSSKRISLGEGTYVLDLKGHTVEADVEKAFQLYGTNLTVCDSVGGGVIKNGKAAAFALWNSTDDENVSAELTFESGSINSKGYAVYLGGASTFNLNDGTITTSAGTAIQVAGTAKGATVNIYSGTVKAGGENAIQNWGRNTVINVRGGELSAVNFAICSRNYEDPSTGNKYVSTGTAINVTGGTLVSNNAIEIQSGSLKIEGDDETPVLKGQVSVGGITENGHATADISGGHFSFKEPGADGTSLMARAEGKVIVSGGVVEGKLENYEIGEGKNNFTITGGTFYSEIPAGSFAEGAPYAKVCSAEDGSVYTAVGKDSIQTAANEANNAVVVNSGDLELDAETTKAVVANEGSGIVSIGDKTAKNYLETLADLAEKKNNDANEIEALKKAKDEAEKAQAEAEKAAEEAKKAAEEAKKGQASAELDTAKTAALAELGKVDLSNYVEPERSVVAKAIEDAKAAISSATSADGVKAALAAANSTIAGQAVYDAKLPKVTSKKAGSAKKALTAKWKKLSKKNKKKVSGIEIMVATDKNFTADVKTVTAKKSAASKKIKKLNAKKTYYVKVRTYKTTNGVKTVGAWSKVKKVKTK